MVFSLVVVTKLGGPVRALSAKDVIRVEGDVSVDLEATVNQRPRGGKSAVS